MISKKLVWINCICFLESRVKYLKENMKEGIFLQIQGSLSSIDYAEKNNAIKDIDYDKNLQS